jgi:hypothetical protein
MFFFNLFRSESAARLQMKLPIRCAVSYIVASARKPERLRPVGHSFLAEQFPRGATCIGVFCRACRADILNPSFLTDCRFIRYKHGIVSILARQVRVVALSSLVIWIAFGPPKKGIPPYIGQKRTN